MGAVHEPTVGAEFVGQNRVGPYRWSMGGRVVIRLSDALTPRKTMLERGMRRTLERIKAAAEGRSAGQA